jgi:hypothetical protein
LAATRNETWPGPCPDVGERFVTQVASAAAFGDQSQSAFPVTLNVTTLVASFTEADDGEMAMLHLVGDGPTLVVVDVEHAEMTNAQRRTLAPQATRDPARHGRADEGTRSRDTRRIFLGFGDLTEVFDSHPNRSAASNLQR